MARSAVIVLIASIAASSACDKNAATFPAATAVTAPSPPPAPAPPPPVRTGSISLKMSTPPSGATVSLGDCVINGSSLPCTDQVHLAFDVVLNQPIRWPVLYVEFRDGGTGCGWSAAGFEGTVPADTVLALSTAVVRFWFPSGGGSSQAPSPCSFPAATNRIFVNLWSEADGEYMANEFDLSYTFARP